jgi:hypothetical protein
MVDAGAFELERRTKKPNNWSAVGLATPLADAEGLVTVPVEDSAAGLVEHVAKGHQGSVTDAIVRSLNHDRLVCADQLVTVTTQPALHLRTLHRRSSTIRQEDLSTLGVRKIRRLTSTRRGAAP